MARLIEHKTGPCGSVRVFETSNVCAYLMRTYDVFPHGAALFHGETNVTPHTEADVATLRRLSGKFTLVVPVHGPLGPVLLATAISTAVAYVMRPKIDDLKSDSASNNISGSPTNALARQANTARMGERVPDIYGKLDVIPDLLAPELVRYEDGMAVEYRYFCIGRGEFTDPTFYDGGVNITTIGGYSAKVFGPGDEITATPQKLYGENFEIASMAWTQLDGAQYGNLPPRNLYEMLGVILWPDFPNERQSGLFPRKASAVDDTHGHLDSVWPSQTAGDYERAFNAQYPVGSYVRITSVASIDDPPGYVPTGLVDDTVYRVLKSTRFQLWLDIPEDKLAVWNAFPENDLTDVLVNLIDVTPTLTYSTRATTQVLVNFCAKDGLYFSNYADDIEVELRVHSTWTPRVTTTPAYIDVATTATLAGNSKTTIGRTIVIESPYASGVECDVELFVYRMDAWNHTVPGFSLESCATVDLESIYACRAVDGLTNQCAVTTVLTRVASTVATRGLSSRKLVASVTRRVENSSGVTIATRAAIDALYSASRDAAIGNQAVDNLDTDAWASAAASVFGHFGNNSNAVYFDAVFDSLDTSFEDMVHLIAQRMYCIAYRLGSLLELRPDIPQTVPTLLFNHRNKLPDTEARVVRFGSISDYDSVRITYMDEDDEYIKKELVWPVTGTSHRDVSVRGVTSYNMALAHAKREYARDVYERTHTTFEATAEAALLVPGDLVLNVDNTRPDVQDGELVGCTGGTLTLSREVTLETGASYVIFLQGYDGVVTSYPVTTSAPATTRVLAITGTPQTVTDMEYFARTTFLLVKDPGDGSAGAASKCIVEAIEPAGKMTYTVSAKNYDERVYDGDV